MNLKCSGEVGKFYQMGRRFFEHGLVQTRYSISKSFDVVRKMNTEHTQSEPTNVELPAEYEAPQLLCLGQLRALIKGAGTPNRIDNNLGFCSSNGLDQTDATGCVVGP